MWSSGGPWSQFRPILTRFRRPLGSLGRRLLGRKSKIALLRAAASPLSAGKTPLTGPKVLKPNQKVATNSPSIMEDVVDEAYASPGDYIELDKFCTVNYIVVITREWVANDNPISTTWSLIYQVLSRPERIVQGEGMYLQNYLDVNDELIPETDSIRYLACKA